MPKPTYVDVITNEHELILDGATNGPDFIQCKVSFKNVHKVRDKDTKEVLKNEEGEDMVEAVEVTDQAKFAKTPLPWRIIKKWAEQETTKIAFDGNEICLFSVSASCTSLRTRI